ncbi:MAG TPA: pyridoxamine 5'-phosphate oxidase family protein [Candidatus Dormibacteraeota bacterium]|nr:pyridoxamine 5'-phosphate oxidase family protein [Candidatus Dormibacteraeota bacterium]
MGEPTARTKVRRHPERARYDREIVRSILDEGLICHLGFVVDGTPFVMPTMYARDGDVVYVHGSPVSRMLRTAAGPADVCLTVTLLDGLVLARSVFNHSMNYRSVVVVGRAEEVTDAGEKMAASEALVEHVCRGRWADARHPNAKELNTTTILRLSLDEASAKVRSGGPKDGEADMGLPVWAGEVPLRTRPLPPVPDAQVAGAPGYAAAYARPGWTD